MTLQQITNEPIRLDDLLREVSRPSAGGIVAFVGVVRDNNEGRNVRLLEYEAYEQGVESSLSHILSEVQRKWPDSKAAVQHRTGSLEVGEVSVAVVVSAPHRAEAFEAARWIIDTLKAQTPIWKKEIFEGGEVWVGEGA